MKINIKKAFLLPITGDKWVFKLIYGCMLYIIPAIFQHFPSHMPYAITIYLIISIVLPSLANGYIVESAHNEIKDRSKIMPEWENNNIKYIKQGLLLELLYIIYSIPLLLLGLLIYFPYLLWNYSIYHRLHFNIIDYIGVSIYISMYFILLTALSSINYAKDFKFIDGLNILYTIRLILRNCKAFLVCFSLSFLLINTYTLINICHNKLLSSIIYGINFPINLIILNLFSQFYKQTTKTHLDSPAGWALRTIIK